MYRSRILDRSVESALRASGGVLIDGVRASGKTQTGRHHAASVVILDDGSPSVAAALQVDPRLLLEGETPRLVDEWQLAPELWNTARHEIADAPYDSRRAWARSWNCLARGPL